MGKIIREYDLPYIGKVQIRFDKNWYTADPVEIHCIRGEGNSANDAESDMYRQLNEYGKDEMKRIEEEGIKVKGILETTTNYIQHYFPQLNVGGKK